MYVLPDYINTGETPKMIEEIYANLQLTNPRYKQVLEIKLGSIFVNGVDKMQPDVFNSLIRCFSKYERGRSAPHSGIVIS